MLQTNYINQLINNFIEAYEMSEGKKREEKKKYQTMIDNTK